ncbi:putative sporulation protein YtxC [Litchfieldia salsa]|uniref:Putative sporulation protein YtxC n=1 Tax=Litchfieldia salsa TaxID=930152 RepID=A0A1H0P1B1_9BACI|nr:putative sporulation protein YtxC [Litchfieldia salsa]SDO98495.1 putative sporulation protein YtxC [Litchfieldia salsa]
MIEISFQEGLEAKRLYERLNKAKLALSINYIHITYDLEQTNTLFISIQAKKEVAISKLIIPVLTQYIIDCIEDSWILSIIESDFYFTDIEEQNQILQIAHGILEGHYDDMPQVEELKSRRLVIEEALHEFLRTTITFSFESFIKFRLHSYSEELLKVVELAIDEYKLEQEYQNFVQNLRDYSFDRSPKIERLHIFHDDHFYFFNESFIELKYSDITKHIDRKLILNHPMYIDSTIIAPLVSISPKSIVIYTNEVDHGMVQTIQNIFLERVQIYSKNYFEQVKLQKKI